MKLDKLILAAVLALIILVCMLLSISTQRNKDVSRAMEAIQTLQSQKPETIDYEKIQEFISQEIVSHMATIPTPTNGRDGKDGVTVVGQDGLNGKSAYELWLEAGNSGTLKDFLNSLKGEKGERSPLPELRYNKESDQVEVKYPGDLFPQFIPVCKENC